MVDTIRVGPKTTGNDITKMFEMLISRALSNPFVNVHIPFFLVGHLSFLALSPPEEPGFQLEDQSLAAYYPVTALCCWADMPMVDFKLPLLVEIKLGSGQQ